MGEKRRPSGAIWIEIPALWARSTATLGTTQRDLRFDRGD